LIYYGGSMKTRVKAILKKIAKSRSVPHASLAGSLQIALNNTDGSLNMAWVQRIIREIRFNETQRYKKKIIWKI